MPRKRYTKERPAPATKLPHIFPRPEEFRSVNGKHSGERRHGVISKAETQLVEQFVADQPEISSEQLGSLSTLLRRTPETIKGMVNAAREKFVARAERYVDIHAEATEAALAGEDYEQARMGAQWAIENISASGARIVDKAVPEQVSGRVMIGIKVGGIDEAAVLKINEA